MDEFLAFLFICGIVAMLIYFVYHCIEGVKSMINRIRFNRREREFRQMLQKPSQTELDKALKQLREKKAILDQIAKKQKQQNEGQQDEDATRLEKKSIQSESNELTGLIAQKKVDEAEAKVQSINNGIKYASSAEKEAFGKIKIDFEKKKEAGIPQDEKLCYVNYEIPLVKTENESYAIVRMPKIGCIVWPYRRGTIARRGYMELDFEKRLKYYFNEQAKVLGDVNILPQNDVRPYEPDIAIVYTKNGLNVRIDIEIDEPYAAITNNPTHYIGCGDEKRDANLNSLGWIVIRFSEKQIYQQPNSCLKFVFEIVKSIDSSIIVPTIIAEAPALNSEKQWTIIESQNMANNKERQKYLHHEFGLTEESSYGIKDLKLTPFEISILDKVEQPVFVSTVQDNTITNTKENYSIESNYDYNKKNESELDQHVIFERLSHVYIIDGVQYKAVSNIISALFPSFDADYWAEIKANERGVDPQQVKEEWDANGQKSREAGVFLHQQIENYFLNLPLCHLYHFQYNGIFVENDETIDIQREFNFFKQFLQDNPITPYRTEWKIFDRTTKIAGTVDLICKNGDGYDLYDWKRSSKIHDTISYGCGFDGLTHLTNTTLNHYKLQQNLYRYILENQYGMNIKSMKLVVLHPDFNSYEIIDVERMDNEINTIIRML